MNSLSVLIKPASGLCNMNCKYCFYNDLMENRKIKDYGFMSLKTLEIIVKKSMLLENKNVNFMFQGGEPMLIGLDFYISLISLVEKYNLYGINVTYGIQTNGTLITNQFAKFFSENDFLVGISIDGFKEIQDIYRLDKDGTSTFNSTISGLEQLKKHDVDFNILSVVTNEVSENTTDIYSFLKNLGTDYIQFIPYISRVNEEEDIEFLTNSNYLRFLKELFDLWYLDFTNGKIVSIRYFDDIIKIVMGYSAESCTLRGVCSNQNVIEADGSIYPCDFYVLDNWRIGNIYDYTFKEVLESNILKGFIESSRVINSVCKECRYYNLCKGGCLKNQNSSINDKRYLSKYCEVYKSFFDYSLERFIEVGEVLRNR